MKRPFGTMKKFISLMICTVLVLSAAAPAFAGPEGSESEETASASEIVEINDTRAFVSFAAGAKLQSFSTGKTFVLRSDIDLSDFEGVSVPYLDGCFEGGGHSITGLKIEGDISDCGLFRYVGKNGFVRDLTVEAEIISGDDQKRVGIIAGTNEGEIVRCTSKGSVNAQSHVGGITGCNEESGVIRTCVNEAAIDGKYQTGGIAGMNMGSITGCTNKGGVNNNPRIKKNQGLGDSDAVNISLPNAVTGFAADERANETGGIAGRSIGNIVYCTNEAPVGHSDLGSDTGGIAGRVSGGIMGCENLALISGRQNTGGIAGALDPYRVVSMDRDYYDELVKEFDSLDEAMQNLSDSGRRLGDDITDNFDDISDRVKTLRDSVRGYFDGYDADIRTARDRIHNEINDISDIIDDMDYDFRLKKLKKHVNVLRDGGAGGCTGCSRYL